MRDAGDNNYFAGHRRWILNPQTEQMGSGDIPAVSGHSKANSLWVFDNLGAPRPETREEYVAWPPPGYVPYQVVYARWSFSYDDADFSEATVSMTSEGSSVSVSQEELAEGYGENTLVWIPMGMDSDDAWAQPTEDTTYTVQLSNVLIDGTARSFEYEVTVFDPSAEVTSIALTTLNSSPSLPTESYVLVLGALVVVSGLLVLRLRGDKE